MSITKTITATNQAIHTASVVIKNLFKSRFRFDGIFALLVFAKSILSFDYDTNTFSIAAFFLDFFTYVCYNCCTKYILYII